MYRKKISQQLEFPNFYLPFSGQLDPDNRWLLLAQLVPWDLAEEIYHAGLDTILSLLTRIKFIARVGIESIVKNEASV